MAHWRRILVTSSIVLALATFLQGCGHYQSASKAWMKARKTAEHTLHEAQKVHNTHVHDLDKKLKDEVQSGDKAEKAENAVAKELKEDKAKFVDEKNMAPAIEEFETKKGHKEEEPKEEKRLKHSVGVDEKKMKDQQAELEKLVSETNKLSDELKDAIRQQESKRAAKSDEHPSKGKDKERSKQPKANVKSEKQQKRQSKKEHKKKSRQKEPEKVERQEIRKDVKTEKFVLIPGGHEVGGFKLELTSLIFFIGLASLAALGIVGGISVARRAILKSQHGQGRNLFMQVPTEDVSEDEELAEME